LEDRVADQSQALVRSRSIYSGGVQSFNEKVGISESVAEGGADERNRGIVVVRHSDVIVSCSMARASRNY
jgi:hypothetical protein